MLRVVLIVTSVIVALPPSRKRVNFNRVFCIFKVLTYNNAMGIKRFHEFFFSHTNPFIPINSSYYKSCSMYSSGTQLIQSSTLSSRIQYQIQSTTSSSVCCVARLMTTCARNYRMWIPNDIVIINNTCQSRRSRRTRIHPRL